MTKINWKEELMFVFVCTIVLFLIETAFLDWTLSLDVFISILWKIALISLIRIGIIALRK